jgi:hypothetical protein
MSVSRALFVCALLVAFACFVDAKKFVKDTDGDGYKDDVDNCAWCKLQLELSLVVFRGSW